MPSVVTQPTLLGTWWLVSFQYVPVGGGEPVLPYGISPTGVVVFGPDGGMSMAVAAAGRTPMPGARMTTGTPEQKAQAYDSYLSYAGTWHLDEALQELRLVPVISLNPNWVGVVQVRYTAWGPDGSLILSTPVFGLDGSDYRGEIIWQRAGPG